jgi:hypothetical protein
LALSPTSSHGSSGGPTDWLRVEQQNGQTFSIDASGFASGSVAFDTVTEQSGSRIGWDAGTPADVSLAEGWYSLCATVFWGHDAGAGGGTPIGTVGYSFASPWIDEVPVWVLPQPPASAVNVPPIRIPAAVPHVRITADDVLHLTVGGAGFAAAMTLSWVELAVVRVA